jgi:hypothetical protein
MSDDQWSTDRRAPDQIMRDALQQIVSLLDKPATCNQRLRDDLIKAVALRALGKSERRS